MGSKGTIGQIIWSLKRNSGQVMQHLRWMQFNCLKEIQITLQSTTIGPLNNQLEKMQEVLEVNEKASKDFLRVPIVKGNQKTWISNRLLNLNLRAHLYRAEFNKLAIKKQNNKTTRMFKQSIRTSKKGVWFAALQSDQVN